ncbi:hypothetical protein BaRGS_00005331, partial [Batillaria attramentaria]
LLKQADGWARVETGGPAMSGFTLTPFQTEKLEYFFKFFEPDDQNNLVHDSLDRFMKRILEFTGWERDSPDARECREVHEAFFEILFDKAGDPEQGRATKVTLEDWLGLWSNLIPGCKGLYNFPIWMRLLPKTLFRIIDRDQNGLVTEDELREFYKGMVNLDPREAEGNAKLAYAQMTDVSSDHCRYEACDSSLKLNLPSP